MYTRTHFQELHHGRDAWVTQSVKCPILVSAQVVNSGHEIEPCMNSALNRESCLRFSLPRPLPLPSMLACIHALSLKNEQINKLGLVQSVILHPGEQVSSQIQEFRELVEILAKPVIP